LIFTENQIANLKEKVSVCMSQKRFSHTLGVERCAAKLGALIIPELVSELRVAALLHDVAKEMPKNEQISLLEASDLGLDEDDFSSDGVVHSFCAPIVVKRDFAEFATRNVLSSVFSHTVGRSDMSVFDKIIFISDYIEDGRTYESCRSVREFLFSGLCELSVDDRISRLNAACIMSIDGALEALRRMGVKINVRMYETRNSLLKQNLLN
jgi:predicted HD superfamily hydrolase involved in NAD metabolism